MENIDFYTPSSYGVLDGTSCPTSAAQAHIDKFWNDLYTDRLQKIIDLPWEMDNETLILLNQIFAPRILRPGTASNLDNGHVIPATAHFLAESFLSKINALEFGAHFNKVLTATNQHFCSLITGRDQARLLTSMVENPTITNYQQGMDLYRGKGCTKGVENCKEPSFVLKANNVIYDINPKLMPRIFENHKTFVGYFTILLPNELLMGVSGTNTRLRYHLEITPKQLFKRRQARMTFFDQSHGYSHDYKIWRQWALLDGIRGPFFNLTIERYRTIGPLTVIRMARVEHSLTLHHFTGAPVFGHTEIINFLPMLREMSKWVRSHMPIRKFVVDGWKKKCDKLYIPTAIITKTFQFLWNRKDTDVSRNHAGSMITAATTQIKISEFFIQTGVDISNTNFDELATLLFIQAMIQRAMASKDISFFIKQIHQARAGFWEKISNDLRIIFEPINFLTDAEERYFKDVHGMSLNHMTVYALIMGKMTNFDDHIVHTKLKGHKPLVRISTPKVKDFVFDPPSDGWCLSNCLFKLTLHSFHSVLGSDPVLSAAETVLNGYGFSIMSAPNMKHLQIDYEKNHATFLANTKDFCKHGVPFTPICVPQKTGKYAINKATLDFTRLFLAEAEGNKNANKTRYIIENIRKPVLKPNVTYILPKKYAVTHTKFVDEGKVMNLAAAPFNDEEFWNDCKLDTVHNVVTTEGVEYHEIPYENVVFGLNVSCTECMQETANKADFYYADVGNNIPLDRQAEFYNQVLLNMMTLNGDFALKVPHFGEMIMRTNCDDFIDMLHNFNVVKNNCFAAGEVVITNLGPKGYNGMPFSSIFQEIFIQPVIIVDNYSILPYDVYTTHEHVKKFCATPSAPPPPPSDDGDQDNNDDNNNNDDNSNSEFSELCKIDLSDNYKEEDVIAKVMEIIAIPNYGESIYELFKKKSADKSAKFLSEAVSSYMLSKEHYKVLRKVAIDQLETIKEEEDCNVEISEIHQKLVQCETHMQMEAPEPILILTDDEIYNRAIELGFIQSAPTTILPQIVTLPPVSVVDGEKVEVNVSYDQAEKICSKLRTLHPNLATVSPIIEGDLYFDEEPDSTYHSLDSVVSGNVTKIKGVDKITALQLTSICPQVFYRSKGYQETIYSNDGLFDLPLADKPMMTLSTRFYGKGGDLDDVATPGLPFAIYRGDIPNIVGKYREGVYQIPDVTSGCNKCNLDTFDGMVVGVKNNTVFGPRNKVPLLPFTPVQMTATLPAIGNDKQKLYKDLEQTKGIFEEPHKEAASVVKKSAWKETIELHLVEGTAASGKSSMCRELLKGIVDIVICPTAALAKEYREAGFDSVSWAMGITNAVGKTVLLDEVFAFDTAAMWQIASTATKTYAVGDRHQMFGGDKDNHYTIPDIRTQVPFDKIAKRMVSFTVPHDIVQSVNTHNPDKRGKMTTQSRVVNSIIVHNGPPPPLCQKKTDKKKPGVCESGHLKSKLCVKGACFDKIHAARMKMPTVATVQGLRVKEFHLFMSSSCKQLVNSVHGQKFVAITRHTHALHIYQAVPTLVSLLAIRPLLLEHSCGIGRRDAHMTVYGNRTDVVNAHVFMTLKENCDLENYQVINETVPKAEIVGDCIPFVKPLPTPKAFTLNHKIVGQTRIEKLNNMPDEHDYQFGVPASYMINQFMSGYDTLDVDMPTTMDIELVEASMNDEAFYQPMKMTPLLLGSTLAASEELRKIAPTSSQNYEPHRHVLHTNLRPIIEKRQIVFSQHKRSLAQRDSKKTFVSISPAFGTQQDNSLNHQLHTMVERYGANVQDTKQGAEAIKQFEQLKNGFLKFVDVDKITPMTLDDVALKEMAALQKIQAKERYPDMEPFGGTYESTDKISCFNKKQLKAKIGENAYLNGKVENGKFHAKGGQPVSAQSKAVNQIVMKFILAAEAKVMEACKPGVYFGYGHSRRDFRRRVTRRLLRQKNWTKFAKTCSADISEQDTNKGPWTDLFMRWIYEVCGIPKIVIDIIESLNINWILHALDAKTRVKYRYQSGRADTIFANTCMAIGVAGFSFEFEHLITALFQGDDINIKATNLKTTTELYNKLKLDWNIVGDFVGFLISDDDIYLDLPRIAAKNMTRMIDDKKILNDYVTATKDLLNLHNNPADKYKNVVIAAAKYKTSVQSMEIIYEYLEAFASRDVIADLDANKFGKRSPEYVQIDTMTLIV